MDGEWTRDGLGMDWRWTGQGVEGLEVDSTRTPWTTGGLHRDSTRISGGVINTGPGLYPAIWLVGLQWTGRGHI